MACRETPAAALDDTVLKRLNWLGAHLVASATVTYGKIGLGFPEARVIFLLGRAGAMSGIRISQELGVDRGGVSRALKSLTEAGLIERAPAAALGGGPDRQPGLKPERAIRGVRLTRAGEAILDRVARLTESREQRLTRGLSPQEHAELIALLDRLVDNFDGVAALASPDFAPGSAPDPLPARKVG